MTTATSTRTSKRIHKVVVKHMVDCYADTSYLGEYSDRPESEYAIDRDHSLDCRINTRELPQSSEYVNTHDWDESEGRCLNCDATHTEAICSEYQIEDDCTCGGRGRDSRSFQYFNGPVENYKGESPEDIRKYVRQDYDRMEGLNNQQWCYIGIRAEAQIRLTPEGPIQEITSGGLWGIESDSERSYFAEVEQEELSELRNQLKALGFSKRAITAAFRDVEHKDE